ncbi:MAG: TonB-dependent receptor, partial [Bacteroidaceae bacterium]|nr:TonB-dependent receptor [Bacteroidaceae bacterium]
MKRTFILFIGMSCAIVAQAQKDSLSNLQREQHLSTVNVTARRPGVMRLNGAENSSVITSTELKKAACCNLGESFTTNPSVDVAYADAATGAKQIKLLGLSGTYVQMLSDNIPNFRGLASPYSLGYVSGQWLGGIQVSKGASSVKNGYESITGQINTGYKDCKDVEQVNVNLYSNMDAKLDFNADANLHINDRLSTGLLLHYEDRYRDMDDNHDGFVDDPNVRQFNVMNRWAYKGEHYLMHAMVSGINERRKGGQMTDSKILNPYLINIETDRYEAYLKNAYLVGNEHNTNIALMMHGSFHRQNSKYGLKNYDAIMRTFYASLIFEHDFNKIHSISAGLSYVRDYYNQAFGGFYAAHISRTFDNVESENVTGLYAQYTLNLSDKLVFMAGMRGDISSEYDGFFTPRTHLRWAPNKNFSVRVSAGKGYRTVHALAENNYLLTSGRTLVTDYLDQESAWNYGVSTTVKVPLFGQGLTINAEYYRTDFRNQAVVDYDADPKMIYIHNLDGHSYSNTFQIDAIYTLFRGMTLTAAYRLNDVKCNYEGIGIAEKPLTSKYKGLISASYKTPL